MYPVSEEQIAAAKEVDILDYLQRHEPDNIKRVGNRYVLRDHDSFVISNGKWCWNSRDIGCNTATALNYLIKVREYDFVDAVRHLAGDAPMQSKPIPKAKPPPERLPFALTPRGRDNMRVTAYLQSRGIPKTLIEACIERRLLYESRLHHNCVFVGRDKRGKARFAALRGTLDSFKRDVEGSDKRFGFHLPPDFGKEKFMSKCNTHLYVFESPIDALSHLAISEMPGADAVYGHRLSLGGTALLALMQFLEDDLSIERIIICTDNDEAGNRAAAEIAEKFGDRYKISRILPPCDKDWNAALMAIQKAERLKNHTHHNSERGL